MIEPIYDADGIKIFCGRAQDILPQLGPIECLLTDPPYGLGNRWVGTVGAGTSWGGVTQEMLAQAHEWDAAPYPAMDELIASANEAIVWGGNYYAMPPSRCWLAWVKPLGMHTMADFELAWTSFDRVAKAWHGARNVPGGREHLTQKPIKLMQWCIGMFSGAGTVVDPFVGSGTTLVAARDMGRRAIGIDVSEANCKIAIDRLRQRSLFRDEI
jgi:DNA modification methylase